MSELNPEPTEIQEHRGDQKDVAARRPGTVTAACVIALLLALYEIAAGILLFIFGTETGGPAALWYVLGVLHLAFAGLLVWGAMAALNGQTDRILLYTSMVVAVVMVATFVIQYVSDIRPAGLFMIIVYGALILLLTRPQSKAFFTAS